jgi:ubiquinone/menaquinone biosynthesis C-methylase UbiE
VSIPEAHEANANQATYWNGPGGQHWTDRQTMQDALLAPVAERLLAAARPLPAERAIDIGCGCGATTLAVAEVTGPSGRALGLDISAPMIARAKQRAVDTGAAATFEVADATIHDFSAERADLMLSRFGVMFFADPSLSFANMRRGLKPGGRLTFACWREAKLNPWLTLPLRAATRHAPKLPELGPEDPGPFSFAQEARVRHVLETAGFSEISLTPEDLDLDIAVGLGLNNAIAQSLEIGPASRVLEGQPPEIVAAATAEIRAALTPLVRGANLWLAAAIWIVRARA